MKRGICPKCSSTTILRSRKGSWHGLHQIHISASEIALTECLVCAECGFVEPYVASESDRRKMLKSFDRYEPEDEAP